MKWPGIFGNQRGFEAAVPDLFERLIATTLPQKKIPVHPTRMGISGSQIDRSSQRFLGSSGIARGFERTSQFHPIPVVVGRGYNGKLIFLNRRCKVLSAKSFFFK